MDGSQAFAINEEEISHNAFDDETIVIHFSSGNYFSLKDAASVIWKTLKDQPVSATSIASAFDAASEGAVQEVEQFLDTLLQNRLLRLADNDAPTPTTHELGRYQTPKVEIFEDMQDMLLGDIIHDPTDEGWPSVG